MSIFDLLFVIVVLASIATVFVAAVMAVRGRGRRATTILLRLGLFAVAYLSVVIVVSLVTPRRMLPVGQDLCWDDWCLAVSSVQAEKTETGVRYVVTIRISSRAHRRPQRGRGAYVCVLDSRGRRYDPLPDPATVPLDVLLQPQEVVHVTRTFELPADAQGPVLVMSHGGGFPGSLIIGDSASLFHQPTVVRLD